MNRRCPFVVIITLLKEFGLNLVLDSLDLRNLFRKDMSPEFGDTRIVVYLPLTKQPLKIAYWKVPQVEFYAC